MKLLTGTTLKTPPAPFQLTASSNTLPVLDVLIVGGGLSGLAVAHGLHRLQHHDSSATPSVLNWNLLEARPVLGGRLVNDNHFQEIDLGGAWLWPRQQPNVRQLLATHRNFIQTFPQPDDPSSTRVRGGAVQLIHAMAKDLKDDDDDDDDSANHTSRIRLNTPVTHCRLEEEMAIPDNKPSPLQQQQQRFVIVQTANGQTFRATKVVFAVPPKLLEKHVTFHPPLSDAKRAAMATQHTWMAGVTKVALVYPKRFWSLEHSNMGLPAYSGGPAFQVYDSGASIPTQDDRHGNDDNKQEMIHALTFFAFVPPGSRAAVVANDNKNDTNKKDALLVQQVADQLAQVWKSLGDVPEEYSQQSQSYISYHVQRWPLETYVSENAQPTFVQPHPTPAMALARPEWDGALHFCGSETDLRDPGVMEGALGSAQRVLQALQQGFLPDRRAVATNQTSAADTRNNQE